MNSLPVLVIHAGAAELPANQMEADQARASLHRIAAETYERLQSESALDSVVWAVTQLEDDPQFNAGTGGKLQSDGVARLSAALMDGHRKRFSGVVNLEETKNPILVAKKLLEENDRVLASEGAQVYARAAKFPPYDPITEKSYSEWQAKAKRSPRSFREGHGTVGAVAVDRSGNLAAATSTGGKGVEIVGRVSDSATAAGTYASRLAAVSATGIGEEIVEHALATKIVTRVDDGLTLSEAMARTFSEFRNFGGRGGVIAVDAQGNFAVETSTPCILHAIATSKGVVGYP